MKTIITFFITTALSTFALAKSSSAQVDTQASKVTWSGSKKLVNTVHTGNIAIKSGSVVFDKDQPQSAEVIIDVATITNVDLTDATYNAKLVNHLKSEDFFDAAKFPTAQLKVTKFSKAGAKSYNLEGELTIRGVTQPIKLTADVAKDDAQGMSVQSKFSFDRTKFGLKYGSDSFFKNLGDKVINDKVDVSVDLVLKKQK